MDDRALEPLHRFPVFHTSSVEVLKEKGTSVFGASRIELQRPDRFDTRANFVQLRDIALAYASINSDIELGYPESDFVRLQIGLSGFATTTAGGQTTEVTARQACVTSVGLSSRMLCAGDNSRLTLRLAGSALDRMLFSLLGFRPKGTLAFTPAMALDEPTARGLLQMLMFLARQLDSTSAELPAPALRELEQAITVAVLCAGNHSFSQLLGHKAPHASLSAIRRTEEYIYENWNKPIRIDELVATTGISARSLFSSFKKAHGYSPIAFAKMIRLDNAKKMLQSANPAVSVTGIAFKCGFGNLGHFAADYRRAFGELPSDTLARERSRRRMI